MSWKTEWKALSNRIQGVVDAAYYVRPQANSAVSRHEEGILRAATTVADALCDFYFRHSNSVPHLVSPIFQFKGGIDSHLRSSLWKLIPELILVRSEIEYFLSDTQVALRSLVERSFAHLQRLIIADEDVRIKWVRAFRRGEVACEKLGAAHLLSHGIWAFKANAEGERTDLILGGPIPDRTELERIAEGLVLTEWKLVRRQTELLSRAGQARAQAHRYSSSSLAGFELSARRYIVLVSTTADCSGVPEVELEGVTYRHIGIALNPKSPSQLRSLRKV